MPTTSRPAEIEVPEEVPSSEPSLEEVAVPVALGVDTQDVELFASAATEPVEEVLSVTESAVDVQTELKPLQPEPLAPSLMIEDSDPLGLSSVDEGFGSGRGAFYGTHAGSR